MTVYYNYEIDKLGPYQFRLTKYLSPIAFQSFGSWVRITNQLGQSGDPTMPIGVEELVQFRISNKLAGQSPVAFFGKGQSQFRWTPLGTNNNIDGVVSDSEILFEGAWNNADLKMIVANNMLYKYILLKSGHSQQYQFRIDSHTDFDPDTLQFGDDFRILSPVLSNGEDVIQLDWDVSQNGGKYILTVNLPIGDFSGYILDPTIIIQPDATDGADSWFRLISPNTNYSLEKTFRVGRSNTTIYREVIKFDLSVIPVGSTINSAVVSAYYTSEDSTNNVTMAFYRLLRDWILDEVTWNSYSTGNLWTTGGANGVGTDREGSAVGTYNLLAAGEPVGFKDVTISTSSVQNWIDGVSSNYGWVLKMTSEPSRCYYVFNSSNFTTPSLRPKFTIDYTEPSSGGGLSSLSGLSGLSGLT